MESLSDSRPFPKPHWDRARLVGRLYRSLALMGEADRHRWKDDDLERLTEPPLDLAPADEGSGEIELEVVKLAEAKRGFVLLPRRWVAERTFAWTTRFRRLVRDYERLPQTLTDLHVVALVCIILKQAAHLANSP